MKLFKNQSKPILFRLTLQIDEYPRNGIVITIARGRTKWTVSADNWIMSAWRTVINPMIPARGSGAMPGKEKE